MKQPMLACSEIPDLETQVSYPCYIQPKFDGIRCVAIGGVAYSRKMKPIPNQYIQKFFADNKLHGLDGELMINGDFNKVQSAVMSEDGEPNFYYAVYDYWDSNESAKSRMTDFSNAVMVIRDTRLRRVVSDVAYNSSDVQKLLEQYIKLGYEGAMLRSIDGKYKQGRSTFKEGYLLKLKKFLDDEAVIIGFEERMTNTNEQERDERGYAKRSSKKAGLVGANTLGSLLLSWNGIEFGVGSGFTDAERQEIWDNRDEYLGRLITFKYQELSKYGVPRFPTFKWWRKEYE